MDNGWPWGSGGDLPTPLALWLWGLGCEIIWNPPSRPQANGKVERYHGLIDQWGEPERCPNWTAWEARIAWLVELQRCVYPAKEGKSRLEAHPELAQNPRRYVPETPTTWELARVERQLSQGLWRRRVGKKGQISLYHRTYSVGSAYRGEEVYVRYEPESHEWVVQNPQGKAIKRWPAGELTSERIQKLDVSYRKPHEQRPAQEPNLVAYVVT